MRKEQAVAARVNLAVLAVTGSYLSTVALGLKFAVYDDHDL